MKNIGITYEELLNIYAANGHQVKQPNSVKAICEALNVVASSVIEVTWARFDTQAAQIQELAKQLAEVRAALLTQSKAPARVTNGAGRLCYCGTFVSGDSACPTCYAAR